MVKCGAYLENDCEHGRKGQKQIPQNKAFLPNFHYTFCILVLKYLAVDRLFVSLLLKYKFFDRIDYDFLCFLSGKNETEYLLNGWEEKSQIWQWLWVSEGLIPACTVKNAALCEKRGGCERRDDRHLSKKWNQAMLYVDHRNGSLQTRV